MRASGEVSLPALVCGRGFSPRPIRARALKGPVPPHLPAGAPPGFYQRIHELEDGALIRGRELRHIAQSLRTTRNTAAVCAEWKSGAVEGLKTGGHGPTMGLLFCRRMATGKSHADAPLIASMVSPPGCKSATVALSPGREPAPATPHPSVSHLKSRVRLRPER